MRTFDYRHLPEKLFTGEVGDATARIYQDKGKLELLQQLHPEQLAPLCKTALFDNVDASARIEGLYVDKARISRVLEGDAAQDETEAQMAGYAEALRLLESPADLDISTATVLKLYETLYGHRNLGRKSRYRKKDYAYVQVDGHMEAMPVSPITAFETPLVLGGACDGLADAFDAQCCSPVVLAAVFTVDFLCIRPFDEGNGRIARLFADFLLRRAGFGVARYCSVDRLIEASAMDYYDALNACVDKWDRGANDYAPFVAYWLDVVHRAYAELFRMVELNMSAPNSKSDRVRLFVLGAGADVTKRRIREAFPDISEATVENVLGKMVRDGEAVKIGAGRATAYRANPAQS